MIVALIFIVMKTAILAIFVVGAACVTPSPPPHGVPWVSGFEATAASDTLAPAVSQRMAELSSGDPGESYGGIEVHADVVGDTRSEVILASFHQGLVVTDPRGAVLARAPGFATAGSADDLVSLAVGDGLLGAPIIVFAFQMGGHREATTWLALYRVGHAQGRPTLEQLFMEPIEKRDGDQTSMGALAFVPNGLIYRAPGARSGTRWTFDAAGRRYVEQRPGQHEPLRHRIQRLTDSLRYPAV